MFGVKDDPILKSVLGAELIQVCFGHNDLILNFFGDIVITILVDVGSSENDFAPVHPNTIPNFLLRLLGKKILLVDPIDNETLKIIFDDSLSIQIKDDSKQFESVLISFQGQILVI